MKLFKFILSKIAICIFACLFLTPAYAEATNLPMSEIGDYGSWLTEQNVGLFTTGIKSDITDFQSEFQKNQLVQDYVPIEAKVGLAFMHALSWLGETLKIPLVRFVIIFIIIAYAFWVMLEVYNMISKGSDVKELVESLLKKALVITIWILILDQGAAKIFMWVVGPIISVGTYLSDIILNAVANAVGTNLPDTCGAIREYANAHASANMLIDTNMAADILCVPTRLSGFFYTAIATGWKWIIAGIGTSAFSVLVGIVFIVIFLVNIWKFALMALGVIADLFLAIILLPFTAIAETVAKTSYKGIAGDIFNGFLGLFKTESLETQIKRFIDAAIYFVSLSIVIAICAALMAGTVSTDLSAQVPTLENAGFVVTLLSGCLVTYLAFNAEKIAKDIGGSINSDIGKDVGEQIKKLLKNTYNNGKSWVKAYKDSKK